MSPIRTFPLTMRAHHFRALLTMCKNLRRDQIQEFADTHQQREEILEAIWVLAHAITHADVAGA